MPFPWWNFGVGVHNPDRVRDANVFGLAVTAGLMYGVQSGVGQRVSLDAP